MSCEIRSVGELLTVELSGEIDHHSAKDIREKIDEAIEFNMPTLLIIDFGGVTFMDSSGIGLVMGRYKIMKSIGGKVILASLSGTNEKLMKLAGLERLDNIEFKETASL